MSGDPSPMFSGIVSPPTNLSLSRARPPRANIADARKLAKREGLQARASLRPLGGCSEKLGFALRC